MTSTVSVNNRTIVHKRSGGYSIAFPNVCKLANGTPVPFISLALAKDAAACAATVLADGESVMIRSSYMAMTYGDEPGVGGGVISGKNGAKASFLTYSADVLIEGEPVPRAFDSMQHNHGSPPNITCGDLIQNLSDSQLKWGFCMLFCTCLALGERGRCCVNQLGTPVQYYDRYAKWATTYDPVYPGVYPEVPFRASDQPPYMSGQRSGKWRDANGLPIELPEGDNPPRLGSRRPDVTVVKNPEEPPGPGNIRALVEFKFPGDNWRFGQEDDYNAITEHSGGEVWLISKQTCGDCEGENDPKLKDPDPVQPEKSLEHSWAGEVALFGTAVLAGIGWAASASAATAGAAAERTATAIRIAEEINVADGKLRVATGSGIVDWVEEGIAEAEAAAESPSPAPLVLPGPT